MFVVARYNLPVIEKQLVGVCMKKSTVTAAV
jgi:hypothetical protein